MRLLIGIAGVAAVAGAGLALAGGPAFAATASVTPSTVAPGGTLTVTVSGCPLFNGDGQGAINIAAPGNTTQPDATGNMTATGTGTVRVPATARSGTWSLWVFCAGTSNANTTFTVSPTTGPNTGDGATAGGPDTTMIAGGVALLGVAMFGGALLAYRRRAVAR